MIRFPILLLMLLLPISVFTKATYTSVDSLVYEKYIADFKDYSNKPINDLLVETALYFKDKPYVASTLDINATEQLVINLQQFDCNTFVETCMALAKTIKSENYTFDSFCENLQKIRYRNAIIDGYTSRLHYVSDWSFENEKQNIVYDRSYELGGKLETKRINFMSSHANLYNALKDNTKLTKQIQFIEEDINQREHFVVIPKQRIKLIEPQIKDGDIIAFATSINGLDYSHIAIAYHVGGQLKFIHASTSTMSVIVEPRSLANYCSESKKCTGISVFGLVN